MLAARIQKHFKARPDAAPFDLDIDVEMMSGCNILFGPSGSGKTLTLDTIAGFVRPEEGRILLLDEILFDSRAGVHLTPQRRHCGYVFQKYALFPNMTLKQNLEFASGTPKTLEKRRKVNEIIDRFRLADVGGLRPHELSGGQKQRCSIARALIGEPRILLLDEPSQGLDAALRQELYGVLRQVRSEFKTPVLLVTHDLAESFELGDERDTQVLCSLNPTTDLAMLLQLNSESGDSHSCNGRSWVHRLTYHRASSGARIRSHGSR